MLTDGDGFGGRRDIADPAAGIVGGERQRGFEFRVSGEPLGPRQEQGAPRRVEPEGALPGPAHGADHVVAVTQDKIGPVHKHRTVGFGLDLEAPDHRLRKRLLDRAPFVGIVALGAEAVVRLHHQQSGTDPVEPDDPGPGELAPVETDIIGADPGRHRRDVEQFLTQPADLEPDLALTGVPVHRNKPVDLVHPAGLVGESGQLRPPDREWRRNEHGEEEGMAGEGPAHASSLPGERGPSGDGNLSRSWARR